MLLCVGLKCPFCIVMSTHMKALYTECLICVLHHLAAAAGSGMCRSETLECCGGIPHKAWKSAYQRGALTYKMICRVAHHSGLLITQGLLTMAVRLVTQRVTHMIITVNGGTVAHKMITYRVG